MSQNFPSIFSDIGKPKSSEDNLESKMSSRADTMRAGTTYEE